jgi:hypothetical protein
LEFEMKILFAALTMTFLAGAVQATEIRDPNGHIDRIGRYLGFPNFEEDFKCGDKTEVKGAAKVAAVKVQSLDMTQEVICKGTEKLLRTNIVSAGGALDNVEINGVELNSNIFENIDTSDLVLDRKAYENDPTEYLFKMLEYLGKNEIEIKAVNLERVNGPDGMRINGLVIRAEITLNEFEMPGMFKKMNVKVFISKDLPAVSRIFRTEISTGKVLLMNTASAKLEVTSVRRVK